MLSEPPFVLKPNTTYPLYITAKRYRPDGTSGDFQPGAITLILLHATSLHKETWEPTLKRVFDTVTKGRHASVNIHEAWAIECPNHGESAQLNEAQLQEGQQHHCNFTCKKYAHAVHRFMTAGPVDFSGRNLVGIGHSLGGVAMTILQNLEPLIAFSSVILVEPMLSPNGAPPLAELRKSLIKGACERKDVWPNRSHALKDLTAKARKAPWDRRALALYVKHGLMVHKGAKWEPPYMGVTLACTRDEEAAMYRDVHGGSAEPVSDLNRACVDKPVHLIIGEVHDAIPREVQDALVDPKSGRKFASVTRLKNIGHLIPQQAPDALGHAIVNILKERCSSRL